MLPTPKRCPEMHDAFADAREDQGIGVVLLTGAGPHTDRQVRLLLQAATKACGARQATVDEAGVPRLNVLDLQKLIRSMPKVVIALVAGYAIGGGHVLQRRVRPDDRRGQRRFRTSRAPDGPALTEIRLELPGPDRGQKKAREIWYPLPASTVRRRRGDGLVNAVVAGRRTGKEGVNGARRFCGTARLAIRCLKSRLQCGRGRARPACRKLAGERHAALLHERGAKEFHRAQREKRKPDAKKFPWLPRRRADLPSVKIA